MTKFFTQTRDDHLQDVLGFMSIGVVVTKIMTMTLFQKCVQVKAYIFAAVTSGRSVVP